MPQPIVYSKTDCTTYPVETRNGVRMFDMPNDMLLRYNFINPTAKTNLGCVWEGVSRYAQQPVVIKASWIGGQVANEQSLENPVHEVRLLRHLEVSGKFPRVYDEFSTGTCHFYIMEPLGRDIFVFLDQEHKHGIPEKLCRRMFQQILDAVNVLDQNGLVHLDLKPENLMVDEKQVVRIIDLGQAQVPDRAGLVSGVWGTAVYRAPEQRLDEKYDGKKADMFSLGATLFTMATGCNVCTVDTRVAFLKMLKQNTNLDRWFAQCPQLSNSLISLLKGLLCYDPHARFSLQQAMNHRWVQGA